MSKRTVRLYDTIKIPDLDKSSDKMKFINDNFFGPQRDSSLLIRIAATHAGIITKNNGFYLPDRMQEGATTMMSPFPKPILLHHDSHTDPIGRIMAADYIDTANALFRRDEKFKDFTDPKKSFITKIELIDKLFNDGHLTDPNFQGLGFISVVAKITDPAAIAKVMDNRYMTVSIGASTDKAVCSICKADWVDEGPCEHRPGRMYEDKPAFIIAGNLTYEELSFVNSPADPFARVIEVQNSADDVQKIQLEAPVEENGFTDDAAQVFIITDDNHYAANLLVNKQGASTEEGVKELLNKIKAKETTVAEEKKETTSTDAEDKSSILKSLSLKDVANAEVLSVKLKEAYDFLTDSQIKEAVEAIQLEASKAGFEDKEDNIWNLIHKALGVIEDRDFDADATYAEMEKIIIELGLSTDAKLSTAKRKSLPSSSFCGPNRSFPVPDCAHVTAARRLIGRAKVTAATKSRILACVSRKAKAMGCGGDSIEEPVKEDKMQETIAVVESTTAPAPESIPAVAAPETVPVVAAPEATSAETAPATVVEASAAPVAVKEDVVPVPAETPAAAVATVVEEKKEETQPQATEAVKVEEETCNCEELKKLSNEQLEVAFKFITAEAEERKLLFTKQETTSSAEINKELEEKLVSENKELREQLSALRSELKDVYIDCEELEISKTDLLEKLRTTLSELHKEKANRVCDLRVLLGEIKDKADLEKKLSEEVEKASEVVRQSLKDLTQKVDLYAVSNKINNGMSNVPEGTVENPTLSGNEEGQKKSNESHERIRTHYRQLLTHEGKKQADSYRELVLRSGMVPKNFKF